MWEIQRIEVQARNHGFCAPVFEHMFLSYFVQLCLLSFSMTILFHFLCFFLGFVASGNLGSNPGLNIYIFCKTVCVGGGSLWFFLSTFSFCMNQ